MVPINNYFFLMSFKRASGIYINDLFLRFIVLKSLDSHSWTWLERGEKVEYCRSLLSNACLQASVLEWNTIISLTMCPHFFRTAPYLVWNDYDIFRYAFWYADSSLRRFYLSREVSYRHCIHILRSLEVYDNTKRINAKLPIGTLFGVA